MAEELLMAVDELCDRIDREDGRIHAFVPEDGRRARLRAEAEELPRRWPDPARRPPLYGVPVGVKDILHATGLPTRAGSALPPEVLTGPEATVVTRLREAGALIAGKTVTAEFAFTAPGPTRNPRDLRRTPGGSSSGSAAAVAAGLVPLALGTQTIGSVIRPAAYCGIVGLKPSSGRIPADGVIPNAPSLDTVGLLAVDTTAAGRAASVLYDAWHPVPSGDGPAVLGVPDGPYLHLADRPARAAFEARLDALRRAGFEVRRVPVLHDLEEVVTRHQTINLYELAATHRVWAERYAERYHPLTVRGIREGRQVTEDAYAKALHDRATFTAELTGLMASEGLDAWIAPAATGPAPADLSTTGSPLMNLPWTQAGLPVVGLPAGAVDGVPVGVQCAGRPGADEALLHRASWIAEAVGTPMP